LDLVDNDPLRQFGDEARRFAAEFLLDDVSVMTKVAAKKPAGVIPRIFTELAAVTGLRAEALFGSRKKLLTIRQVAA